MLSFTRDPEWLVAHFSLSDISGDSGIVGAALVRGVTGGTAAVDTLLMSCRVIGRRAEHAFVHHVLRRLVSAGVESVKAAYVPTAKNAMVRDFWPSVGFTAVEAGDDHGGAANICDLRGGAPDVGPMPMNVIGPDD